MPGVKQWDFGTSTAHQIQTRYSGKTFLPCTPGDRLVPAEQARDVQQYDKNEKNRQHNGHDNDSTGKQYQPNIVPGRFSQGGTISFQ